MKAAAAAAAKAAVRVRYAPSPTGQMHLGGLRTALYNYLFARKHNGSFVLRIEDTDKSREVPGSADAIRRDLEWAGIPYDEGPGKERGYGPYVQSERLPLYHKHADILLQKSHAYRCFCDEHRLASLRDAGAKKGGINVYDRFCLSLPASEAEAKARQGVPHTVRMKVPPGLTHVDDIVRGRVTFQNAQVDDQILLKSDRFPTYHFASVVDDHLMDISHVIRGEEWLSSVPKHLMLYDFFGWTPPKYAHLPLLLNEDKTKLSKRQNHASAGYYKDQGYFPEALMNFVAFLGWSPGDTREVFTMNELVEAFSLEKAHRAPAVVSPAKLDWFNQQHLRLRAERDLEALVRMVKPWLAEKARQQPCYRTDDDKYIGECLTTLKDRLHRLEEFPLYGIYFFSDPVLTPDRNPLHTAMWDAAAVPAIDAAVGEFELIGDDKFTEHELSSVLQRVCKSTGVKMGKLYKPLRYLLTGSEIGASIALTMQTLGRRETLKRLKDGLGQLR